MKIEKAKVTLGGVSLAATSGIAWRFVGGVVPYSTTFSVHASNWDRLKSQIGTPMNLKITDSRGVETSINQVYILHEAPSDSPHRVSFVVADKRWRWPYKLVARDYNMPRKTGDRTAKQSVPVETQVVVDNYDYLSYSLAGDQGTRWTSKELIEDVLEIIHDDPEVLGYQVKSWPIKDTSGGTNTGEFSVQGVTLRDSGDVALSRALSYVPGADVYVDARGVTVVYDATDLDDLDAYYQNLPVDTYAGEKPAWIDRKAIRPSKIVAHYQREVEVLLNYEDDYSGGTSAAQNRSAPYVENVGVTVDPETEISNEFDPESGMYLRKTVPAGTWVEMSQLLEAWDKDRPTGSLPWDFDTIKTHWLKGDLEGVLGARGLDLDKTGNVAMRVQSLRQHFRQTFRINRRYMERVRSLRAVRVGLLDPVTGARAPAAVWGQATIVPSTKGKYMAARGTNDPAKLKYYRIVDPFADSAAVNEPVLELPPGPARVSIVDDELGVFRTEWIVSPYGTVESYIPCRLASVKDPSGVSASRDMALQEDEPMGPAMQVEGGTNSIFLADKHRMQVLLTMVPSAPNNERQFHKEEVEARDVASIFQREFRIKDGDGPELHVFVSPGEATARFALQDTVAAYRTVQDLFGLTTTQNEAGIEGPELPGYQLMNQERFLAGHAISLAAELLASYADNVQGALVTRVPDSGIELKGNTADATIRVAAAPSAKVDAVHNFPGQSKPISRLAVMPESTRQIVLGIVPYQ